MECSSDSRETTHLGYRHPDFARSFIGHGTPHELVHSEGWIIQRSIAGTPYYDAMGPYPLFQCHHWNRLPDDLEALRATELISLVMVSDPMLSDTERQVFGHFDMARPFKTHYLTDLELPYEQSVSSHHRYYVRKASKVLDIDIPKEPIVHLDEWCILYKHLMKHHNCSDIRTFSREGFRLLLEMPGVILLRALKDGKSVGALVIMLSGDVAHLHLMGFTPEGYQDGVTYFLIKQAMNTLRDRVRFMNIGGGTGTGATDTDTDGLTLYKQGWSTERRTTYLLGAILNRTIYEQLEKGNSASASNYFPRYRA